MFSKYKTSKNDKNVWRSGELFSFSFDFHFALNFCKIKKIIFWQSSSNEVSNQCVVDFLTQFLKSNFQYKWQYPYFTQLKKSKRSKLGQCLIRFINFSLSIVVVFKCQSPGSLVTHRQLPGPSTMPDIFK
jgi:hypothetical protein